MGRNFAVGVLIPTNRQASFHSERNRASVVSFQLPKANVGRHAAVGVLAATYRSASFHARHPAVVDDRILYIVLSKNKISSMGRHPAVCTCVYQLHGFFPSVGGSVSSETNLKVVYNIMYMYAYVYP